MSAPICPYCGDGMESIGTLNHIECATKLLAEVERLKTDSRAYWKLVAKKAEADVDGCNGALVEAEAERDRLRWMLVRSVCDECLVHKSGACSEEEGEDCPPVRVALADLAARYDFWHEGGDG